MFTFCRDNNVFFEPLVDCRTDSMLGTEVKCDSLTSTSIVNCLLLSYYA